MRKQSSSYDDEQVLMPVDPLAGDELLEQRLVEPARRLHVDILDDCVLPEAGEPQPSDQPLVLAFGRLTVDQQCEALLGPFNKLVIVSDCSSQVPSGRRSPASLRNRQAWPQKRRP